MTERLSKIKSFKSFYREDMLYADTVLDQFVEVKIKPKTFC